MNWLAEINTAVNNVVWGVPALLLILGAGLLLTLALRGVQFAHFGYAMKNTIGKMFHKSTAKAGEVTPLQAVTTALAATVGTGNITGITWAVTLGGAGALFWLWVAALLGMATKYAEVTLAVKYRERNADGDWVGGPMYYIKNGLGKSWKWLAAVFAALGMLASFGIGNASQVSNIADAANTVLSAFGSGANAETVNLIVGIVVALLVGVVVLGGIKRVGEVTEKLVPLMAALYITACLVVIFANVGKLPHVFGMIFRGAFTPSAVTGGAVGITVRQCITWGVKRGVFSNEAGLGSAPIAHAATSETNPVRQGLYGIFEVFMDTIVICSLTGLTLLLGLEESAIGYGVKGSVALNVSAVGSVFGYKGAAVVVGVGLTLFALSTALSWGLYGTRCIEYLLGKKAARPYQVVYMLAAVASATLPLQLAWDIADTLNGLMAIPNLIGVLLLSPVVVKLTREHFAKK